MKSSVVKGIMLLAIFTHHRMHALALAAMMVIRALVPMELYTHSRAAIVTFLN